MFETVYVRKSVCECGNEILSARICYPRFEGREKTNAFYEKICGNALEYCLGEIGDMARKSFAEGQRIPLVYELCCRAIFEWKLLAAVEMKAVLRRKGSEEYLSEFSDVQWWQFDDDEIMIPVAFALKTYCEPKDELKKIGKKSKVIYERGRFVLCNGKNRTVLDKLKEKNA